jgi:hypothetical protein
MVEIMLPGNFFSFSIRWASLRHVLRRAQKVGFAGTPLLHTLQQLPDVLHTTSLAIQNDQTDRD